MQNETTDPRLALSSVPLNKAQQETTNWRNYIANSGFNERGFFIRAEDLLTAMNITNATLDPNISGVRAYLALNDEHTYCHLYIVGTTRTSNNPPGPNGSNNDIITDENGNSLIFDTTIPCPTICGEPDILNGNLS